jgi:hypothetical protein
MSRAPAKAALQPKITMRRALSDPALLGDVLAGDSWRAWRILLIAMMGEALDDEERATFYDRTGRIAEPLERVEEFWGIVGRRGGKSRAAAVLIVFLSAFVDYRSVLTSGERPIVLCLGQNQKQAAVIFDYVAAIIESKPLLAKLVKAKLSEILRLTNGVDIEIRAASFRGLRGVTAVAVVADEICFWLSDDTGSSNPDSAILDAVRPALATTNGALICISSPYARRGSAYETWARHYGEKGDPRILVAQGASRDFNPSLPQKVVDRAYERDAAAAAAEYGGLFRNDLEAFVSREALETCIDHGAFERSPSAATQYLGFADPSGGSADSFSAAVAHKRDDGVIVLDAVREARPPFSPESVTQEFAQFFLSYRVRKVRGDRYAGEWPREQFRKYGVDYEPAAKPKSELYGELLPVINSRRVALLDNGRMLAQLTSLERRVSRGGRDSIDHPPGGHDDLANAVAGVISMLAADETPGFIGYYRGLAEGFAEDLIRPTDRVVPADQLVAFQVGSWAEVAGFTGRQYRGDPESGLIFVLPEDAPPLERAGFRRVDVESKETMQ